MTLVSAQPVPAEPAHGALPMALWGAQAFLALAFVGLGILKLSQPPDQLLAMGMTFVERTPEPLVRFIGLSELLGGVGLVVPAATRLLPWLTGVAAVLLTVVMVLGAGEHVVHGELSHLPGSVVFGALLTFVAWGRLVRAPIAARA